jgi:hypothetical protein
MVHLQKTCQNTSRYNAQPQGLHSLNLWHRTCVHGILNNTPNFARY